MTLSPSSSLPSPVETTTITTTSTTTTTTTTATTATSLTKSKSATPSTLMNSTVRVKQLKKTYEEAAQLKQIPSKAEITNVTLHTDNPTVSVAQLRETLEKKISAELHDYENDQSSSSSLLVDALLPRQRFQVRMNINANRSEVSGANSCNITGEGGINANESNLLKPTAHNIQHLAPSRRPLEVSTAVTSPVSPSSLSSSSLSSSLSPLPSATSAGTSLSTKSKTIKTAYEQAADSKTNHYSKLNFL